MRKALTGAVAALLACPAALWGLAPPPAAKSGPAIVPYACSDGSTATVIYQNGSDFGHARAKLSWHGRELELRAAPTLLGLRYRGEAADGQGALAWTLRGEQAILTESPDEESYAREEREIARCTRLRAPLAAVQAAGGHAPDH